MSVEESKNEVPYKLARETLLDLATKNTYSEIFPGLTSLINIIYKVCSIS